MNYQNDEWCGRHFLDKYIEILQSHTTEPEVNGVMNRIPIVTGIPSSEKTIVVDNHGFGHVEE
jgi:hypothetical protein